MIVKILYFLVAEKFMENRHFQIDNKKIYKKNHKIFLSSSESIRSLFVGKIDKYE